MALSSRSLEPEWLDELPATDARAIRSRKDLRRINALMGNARLIARHLGQATRIADLGGGDGTLMDAVAGKLQRKLDIVSVDRVHGLDVFEFLRHPGTVLDAIVANLFLHHLEDRQVKKLFALAAARAPLFIACEPRRSAPALWASRLVGLIGCNDVTRHDSVISVRAGFRGKELSGMWPVVAGGWILSERAAPPFSHLFVARRDGIV
jgi:hypothetical protein